MSRLLQNAIDFFGEFVFYSFLILLGLSIGITGAIAFLAFLI